MTNEYLTDEEIQKAISVLEGIGEGQKQPESTQKETDLNKSEVVDILKSLQAEFTSKFESLGTINQTLIEENSDLRKSNEELNELTGEMREELNSIKKSMSESLELIKQMANSPINKLGTTLTKSVQVEKFGQVSDGKEALSLTKDKHKVLNILSKSLDTEEGCKRLGTTIGLIENGYINGQNFAQIQKSVQNEIGGQYNITY
jgi:regulator of replication initiation timing